MQRESTHLPTQRGGAQIVMLQCAEIVQHIEGELARFAGGIFKPIEIHTGHFLHHSQGEKCLAQVQSPDFWQLTFGAMQVFTFRPETQAGARPQSSRTARTLVRAGATDLLHRQRIDAAAVFIRMVRPD